MDKITISNGVTTIEMPLTDDIMDAGQPIFKETEMAGGNKVRDIKGFRPGYSFAWDYIPQSIVNQLIPMLRAGGYFTVQYPDTDGTDQTGSFSISYPQPKVFRFVNGVPMWHDFSITISSRVVI